MGRGKQVTEVFEYFDELRGQAPDKIFTLFGNHEWMNLLGMLLLLSWSMSITIAGEWR